MSRVQIIACDCPFSFGDKLSMSSVKRGALANYSTMNIDQLKNLPVANIANQENGCLLAFWVPSSLLPEGIEIMNAWGFRVKTSYIWVKDKKEPLQFVKNKIIQELKSFKHSQQIFNYTTISKLVRQSLESIKDELSESLSFGMGRLFRASHEICLIGTNNNAIYKQLQNHSQRSVSFAPILKHSQKPEHLQDALELMFPDKNINKIELFARRERPGWLCLGNQSPTSLNEDIITSLSKLQHLTKKQFQQVIYNSSQWANINALQNTTIE